MDADPGVAAGSGWPRPDASSRMDGWPPAALTASESSDPSGVGPGPATSAYDLSLDDAAPPRRRRRTWLAVTGVALAAVVAVAAGAVVPRLQQGGLAVHTVAPTATAGVPGSVAGPAGVGGTSETDAAVTALLERRGTAVTKDDAAAWRSTQGSDAEVPVFARLAALPITEWTYEVDSTTPEGGGSTLVLDVHVRWRLDVDTTDAVLHERLTLRKASSGWLVTSEATADKRAQPWDLGSITVVRGARSLVIGIDTPTSLLRTYARLADTAVPQVTAVWGSDWSQRPVLVVPHTETELGRALARSTGSLGGFAAVTTGEPTEGDATRSALRIWTNTPNMAELSSLGRQVVVRHEITHVATAAPDTPGVPLWLEEGFAEYVGYHDSGIALRDELRELVTAVRRGDMPTHLPSQATFDGEDVDLAYESADLACRLVVERYGQAALVRLYRLTMAGTGSSAANLDAAMQAVTGSGTATFEVAWRARMRALAS